MMYVFTPQFRNQPTNRNACECVGLRAEECHTVSIDRVLHLLAQPDAVVMAYAIEPMTASNATLYIVRDGQTLQLYGLGYHYGIGQWTTDMQVMYCGPSNNKGLHPLDKATVTASIMERRAQVQAA